MNDVRGCNAQAALTELGLVSVTTRTYPIGSLNKELLLPYKCQTSVGNYHCGW